MVSDAPRAIVLGTRDSQLATQICQQQFRIRSGGAVASERTADEAAPLGVAVTRLTVTVVSTTDRLTTRSTVSRPGGVVGCESLSHAQPASPAGTVDGASCPQQHRCELPDNVTETGRQQSG